MAIRQKLAQADAANTEWQRDLSVSHDRIGDVKPAQGDLQAALDAYTAALGIRDLPPPPVGAANQDHVAGSGIDQRSARIAHRPDRVFEQFRVVGSSGHRDRDLGVAGTAEHRELTGGEGQGHTIGRFEQEGVGLRRLDGVVPHQEWAR